MGQLKVMIVGTSPAETLQLEEALQQTGSLDTFRYVGLEQLADHLPNWDEWHLVIARYDENTSPALFALLAPVLRKSAPVVFFLVDGFDPALVTRLLNAGAQRIIPAVGLEPVLDAALRGIFYDSLPKLPLPAALAPRTVGEPAAVEPSAPFRNSPVAIAMIRQRDNICVDCSESLARLLEYPRQELVGRALPELAFPIDIQTYFSQLGDNHLDDLSAAVNFERKISTHSRQIRHVQVYVNLIDWLGDVCFITLVQDITEKEQDKDKIRRLNNELERLVLVRTGALEAANRELAAEIGRRKVVEGFSNQLSQIIWETPDIVAVCALDGRMQYLNKAGRAMLGLSEDETVSHLDLFSFYPEDARRWLRDEIRPQVVRQGYWRGETALQLPDGRVVPISQVLLCQHDPDDQAQFIASVAWDISEFKRVEQELRQSRERYRVLAEAAHDFIFMVSKDGLMEYANEYTCQTLGFNPNKIFGLPVRQFFPKDFASNHLQMFGEVNEIDRPVYTEGPFSQDGRTSAWLGTWLVPIHSEDGSLVSILGISRDITEQKKTDEALQEALRNERKLGEMRANFFSMTSHQFRTPLSTILLSTELLQKYGQKWDDPKRAEHLGRITEAARRLNNMLEDILIIGRFEAGRYVTAPKEFDLVAFCDQSIKEITLNDHYEHPVIFQHTPDCLMVYHDSEVMHRVMDNLLSNAIKYSPRGSSISITARAEGQDIVLEVTDQGIGIPAQEIKYLFQPFQRASNAAEIPGTGIGLTIIQKSIELMRGSISLKSKEGQGTTFMLRFPKRYAEAGDSLPE